MAEAARGRAVSVTHAKLARGFDEETCTRTTTTTTTPILPYLCRLIFRNQNYELNSRTNSHRVQPRTTKMLLTSNVVGDVVRNHDMSEHTHEYAQTLDEAHNDEFIQLLMSIHSSCSERST